MQILINEEKRALAVSGDNVEMQYPDERWQIIHISDDTILEGENIDNRWDGEKFIFDPKQYE